MQGMRLVKAVGRRVHRFSGSVLQGLRLVKAIGSKEDSQVFRFSVTGSETRKG